MDIDQISQWSSITGLVVSIIIGIVSFLINNKVNRIKRRLYLGVKLTNKIREIEILNSELLGLHEDIIANFKDIKLTLTKISEILDQIKQNLNKDIQSSITTKTNRISYLRRCTPVREKKEAAFLIFKPKQVNSDEVYDLYTELSGLLMKLKEFDDNSKLFGTHG